MTLVAGIDSSTQSSKVVVCDAETGTIVRSGSAPHPPGTEIHPDRWWDALQEAIGVAGGIDDVAAVSVGAQQHGMICLDETGAVVRDALLWNDTRSDGAATALIDDLGGPTAWVDETGLLPVASFTVSKLRWLADHEPENADRTAAVCLPHDWLGWRLSGSADIENLWTDRSDASGTGYFSAATGEYHDRLLQLALRGRSPRLPRVAAPHETAAHTATGARLGAGLGDNAAAALALGAGPGDCVVSLGTSGVVSAVGDRAPADYDGLVAGFADATGRQLPLVCTLNGAPVLAAVAHMLGVDLKAFSDLALSAPPGAEGLSLVPYLEGERSPNLPHTRGALHGMSGVNLTTANIARAGVEGLLCSLQYCADRIVEQGIDIRRIILVGGGARSAAVRQIAPSIFGCPVVVPEPGEYVALGAARQAAWTLTGTEEPPAWSAAAENTYEADPAPAVYAQYREASALTVGR
ncbi:xylulokinase [Williamsia limnetica]|uniref:Xylulose kinase n=1 Tax=Williamsia limnetica TaxID=882452 RepID=A0A318RI85_WILLI|nr:xylulokinase [Williamsia limnetica]PYE15840.1 xylulokinase [Williamsia limnetica]